MQVCCTGVDLISMEAFLSMGNHKGTCLKGRQTEAFVKCALAGIELERMQGPKDVTGAEEQEFLEIKFQ